MGVNNCGSIWSEATLFSVIFNGYNQLWYWLFCLGICQTKYGAEGILVGVVAAITLLKFGLGLRSHYIVYAIIAAYGTAITLSFAIAFSVLPILRFSHPLGWDDLWISFAFFGFTGVCISLWLAISYYVVVPILRLICWLENIIIN